MALLASLLPLGVRPGAAGPLLPLPPLPPPLPLLPPLLSLPRLSWLVPMPPVMLPLPLRLRLRLRPLLLGFPLLLTVLLTLQQAQFPTQLRRAPAVTTGRPWCRCMLLISRQRPGLGWIVHPACRSAVGATAAQPHLQYQLLTWGQQRL